MPIIDFINLFDYPARDMLVDVNSNLPGKKTVFGIRPAVEG